MSIPGFPSRIRAIPSSASKKKKLQLRRPTGYIPHPRHPPITPHVSLSLVILSLPRAFPTHFLPFPLRTSLSFFFPFPTPFLSIPHPGHPLFRPAKLPCFPMSLPVFPSRIRAIPSSDFIG